MRGILNIREGRRVVNPSARTAPAPRFISLFSQLFQVDLAVVLAERRGRSRRLGRGQRETRYRSWDVDAANLRVLHRDERAARGVVGVLEGVGD